MTCCDILEIQPRKENWHATEGREIDLRPARRLHVVKEPAIPKYEKYPPVA
jgi:hypothetical protein